MLNLPQKQTEKWLTQGWSWKSLDRIRTQTLVLLIPHTVLSNQTQTCLHLSQFKDLWNENTGTVFSEKYLCVSGPAQFKRVLFKGQLYTGNVYTQTNTHTHMYTRICVYIHECLCLYVFVTMIPPE